jgi:hypothetical protein
VSCLLPRTAQHQFRPGAQTSWTSSTERNMQLTLEHASMQFPSKLKDHEGRRELVCKLWT